MFFKEMKNLRGESPRYDESYNKKQFKSKNPQDIIKAIVEIVKNGVDAYIEEKGLERCKDEKIEIVLNRKDRTIKVINHAEGMDSELFEKALFIGSDTGSKKEQKTGAHGYGMKEASWAFETARIVTIKGGTYSSRVFYWDKNGFPKYAWDKDEQNTEIKDRLVSKKIRDYTKIKNEGTYFEGIMPEEIKWLTFDALWRELSWHVLLRSINQSSKFYIELADVSSTTISRQIMYHPPGILKEGEKSPPLSSGIFSFKYPRYGKITCKYNIYLSNHELNSIGDSKEAGLLICAGPFSVLDCTLFDNGGKIANRFFGEVILDGPLREISKKERILDDRRISGLIKNTPLYLELSNYLNPILRKLIDEEIKKLHGSAKDVDKGTIDNKEKLLRELNKIAESEETIDEIGLIKFDPGESGIRFCITGNYETLLEKQNKNIYLVADTNKVPLNSEIEIYSDKDALQISPNKFKILKKDVDTRGTFKKKISFYSCNVDSFLVTASIKSLNLQDKMNLEVIEDARLHITSPIEFIPKTQNIVEGTTKKFDLIIDKKRVKLGEIVLEKDNLIDVSPIDIRKALPLSDDILVLGIPIHCNGKAGQKTKIYLKMDSQKAILDLEIISSKEKHLHGPFNDIKSDDQKDPSELGYFEDETKTIKVCINHPIFKYYMKSFRITAENPFYRVLYAETVVVEALKELTRKKVKIFSNTEAEEYRVKFDEKFNLLYKRYSVPLHNFCINHKDTQIVEESE